VQITSTADASLGWAVGRRLGALATARNAEPYDLLLQIVRDDRGRTGMVGFGMSEENTQAFLVHPLGMVCSDGSALAASGPLASGTPHPRSFGTFPRVLGEYCRERRAMPLETAIHKMTAMPARRIGLDDRGVVAPGAFADIVVFDPVTVADTATFENPHRYPTGVVHVMVNGEFVLRDGDRSTALPGRVLRSATA
jgi:N-acyl-D-amino-acid deacylase